MLNIFESEPKHPESMEDEYFLGNFTKDDFKGVGHKTKRLGIYAYAKDGSLVLDFFPGFAKKAEVDAHLASLK